MSFFKKKKICVTHNGAFHADDLFATAVLHILNNGNIKIIRTRDRKIMDQGDYVYDVGGENDSDRNKFDHHQKGGAGNREDGIPYSAFGLVWKKFGEQLCGGDKEVASYIEKKIVEPLDAADNAFEIYKSIYNDIHPYTALASFMVESPTWKEENKDIDKIFKNLVPKAVSLLKREIKVASDDLEAKKIIIDSYNKSEDKRIIILNKNFPRYLYQNVICAFSEPVFLVFPSGHSSLWKIETIKKDGNTLESRKYFPIEWRGVFDVDKLREISGIKDIVFCHQSGFLAETETIDGALELANKALIA